jgi:hypothetical protein
VAGPFHNAIRGTTASGPGTGAFTPNAAVSGFLAWSTVPTGWIGLVRYEDGSNWELSYSYWNGTTLSRGTTQRVASSSGSLLSLTSAATAALVADGYSLAPDTPGVLRSLTPTPNSTTVTAVGMVAATATGTAANAAIAATNYVTEQPRVQIPSATTANAQCGYSHTAIYAMTSTNAGRGGWKFRARYAATGLPTGPRLFVGLTGTTYVGNTGEPSALVANYAVHGFDSTDSSVIQLITNSNASTGTKISTGITFAVNGWYESMIWCDPGSTTINALLIRRDTGAIHYTTTNTDVPVNGALLFPQCLGGLSATAGTAFTMQFGGYSVRAGG